MPALDTGDLITNFLLEGTGAPVVLIHGVGSRLEVWDQVVASFGGGYQFLRYDLRGFGKSSKTKGRYELSTYVEDLKKLVDHVDFKKFHLVGFSLGGIVAQAFALKYPERIDHLVLASTFGGATQERRDYLADRYRALKGAVAGEHYRKSVHLYFSEAFRAKNSKLIDEIAEINKKNDPECYAQAYRIIAETDLIDQLNQIHTPTLVIAGQDDPGISEMAVIISKEIYKSKLVLFKGLRHSILIEGADKVSSTIKKFFEETGKDTT